MKEVFERIGIGSKGEFGQVYEEWFITDYDCSIHGVSALLWNCGNLEKRNFLVSCFAMVRYLCGGHPRSVRHLRAATLQISSPIDEPTDVDGQRGARFPLDVRCLPGLLRVVCPRDGRR